jgi:hypothetical protein
LDQTISQWGVQLTGHDFDLLDWEETLKAPFDPWVERVPEMFVLRWSEFDGLDVAEVRMRCRFGVRCQTLQSGTWLFRGNWTLSELPAMLWQK